MVQLQQEGWIHHLARHAVGCFLTRGDLWISWEEGMKVNMHGGDNRDDCNKIIPLLPPCIDWLKSDKFQSDLFCDSLAIFSKSGLLCKFTPLILHV